MKAPPGKLQLHTRKRHPALINQISSYSGRLRLTIKLVAVLISSQSLPDFCQPFQGSWTKIRWIETTTLLHHYHPVTKFLFPPLSLIIKPVLCGEKTYRTHQVHLSQGQTLLPSWHKNFVMQANNPTQGAHTHTRLRLMSTQLPWTLHQLGKSQLWLWTMQPHQPLGDLLPRLR